HGYNASQTATNINKVWGEGTTSDRAVQWWFERFHTGDENFEDQEGRGRPPTLDGQHLKTTVKQNPRQSVRKTSYMLDVCKQQEEMDVHLSKMRAALVNQRGPFLLHDNARLHVSRITLQKLTDLGCETLPLPLYSPKVSLTDFNCFKHLDTFLRQKTFCSKTEIETEFKDFLASKPLDFYRRG
ncbi:histone-lysine N-methyltransferase SETMAR-like, partial [Octopus sinensis]|uniref:Histone-lysine N-methyltransferase SETMAR-like n=1 Tax=Octopus sinensis TaxID=2607531 RepID=A0A6P7TQD8_9MOLL